jgi:UDP-N-acetyl-D-galactosamine dehydrogenase
LLSKILKRGDIIVLESTVYPGVTRAFTKRLEKKTKLLNNHDFSTCYSPERINPGDKDRSLNNINKILAYEGNDKKVKKAITNVYKKISKKLIFSKSIREAETAKGIENIQRDLNIALFNEILIICNKLKLNFNEVVRLASTKWNFMNFSPGLVGGHCLPVDPFYLTYIAEKRGYKSKVTLSGRSVNNYMKKYVINFTNLAIKTSKIKKNKIKICIVGLTYKYGVADTRNSQKIEILKYFKKRFKFTKGFDPFLKRTDELKNYELKKYNFFLFLSKGKEFKKIANLVDKKKIIDPFFYYSN